MKGFFIGAIVAILFVLVAYSSYTIGVNNHPSPASVPTPTASAPALIGGDKDEHGCLGSAGYSWCASKNKCLRVWEEGCPAPEDSGLIKAALFKKNNWPDDNSLTFVLTSNDGKYAHGTVNGQGGGGYFYSAKVNGNWVIVADGNGIIACSQLVNYPDYPKTLIPSCYDTKTDKLTTR